MFQYNSYSSSTTISDGEVSNDKKVKENLHQAQARMKKQYDSHHKERHFQIWGQVYMCLQPYRQSTLKLGRQLNSK